MTTELEQKIAEQAAVIEKLTAALIASDDLLRSLENSGNFYNLCVIKQNQETLAIPTDSKEVLAEWLDKVLGEPFAYVSKRDPSFVTTSVRMSKQWVYSGFGIEPLFKKPECKMVKEMK